MKLFLDNPNQVFSKEALYEQIWGEAVVDDNAVMVYINRLRNKIEPSPKTPIYIQTIWGKATPSLLPTEKLSPDPAHS